MSEFNEQQTRDLIDQAREAAHYAEAYGYVNFARTWLEEVERLEKTLL